MPLTTEKLDRHPINGGKGQVGWIRLLIVAARCIPSAI